MDTTFHNLGVDYVKVTFWVSYYTRQKVNSTGCPLQHWDAEHRPSSVDNRWRAAANILLHWARGPGGMPGPAGRYPENLTSTALSSQHGFCQKSTDFLQRVGILGHLSGPRLGDLANNWMRMEMLGAAK